MLHIFAAAHNTSGILSGSSTTEREYGSWQQQELLQPADVGIEELKLAVIDMYIVNLHVVHSMITW